MFSEARNWKWMVPGVLFGVLLLLARGFLLSPAEWVRWTGLVPCLAAAVCGLAAVGNFWDYRRAQALEVLERRRRAVTMTQLSAELEAARGVHPEAVKVLINERHRVWMLKSGARSEGMGPHAVLFGAPEVTDQFLSYFLANSSQVTVMPKRLLVDGRKNRFDPWGTVTEYEMYDRLCKLLEGQGKVVKWNEFQPYEWMEPWSPALVAEDFGLDFEDETEIASDTSRNDIKEGDLR